MQAMPAFFRDERGVLVSHRGSFGRAKRRSRLTNFLSQRSQMVTKDIEKLEPSVTVVDFARNTQVFETAFGRCAMQYSSPSRATRKSRFGSLSSVAPQTAQRCSVSAGLRESVSKRLRRVETSCRCRA